MEVKEAILAAKNYISDIYRDEGVFNVGLEEVESGEGIWEVTIGFSRQWDRPPYSPFSTAANGGQPDFRATTRTYKIVEIDDVKGTVRGVRNRPGLL